MSLPVLLEKRILKRSEPSLVLYIYLVDSFFDVVLSAPLCVLKDVKHRYPFSSVVEDSVFGFPILIFDSSDSFYSACIVMDCFGVLLCDLYGC